MKKYGFTLDIKGTCFVQIEADSLEDAVEKLMNGHGESELNEWEIQFPYNTSTSQMKKFCSENPDKVRK